MLHFSMPFADKIIDYNLNLTLDVTLPEHICVMNPYQDPSVRSVTEEFYRKFYNDSHPRRLIMGINPGRFGAGVTGIPFTDSVRLKEKCGILSDVIPETKELSSVFVYEVISLLLRPGHKELARAPSGNGNHAINLFGQFGMILEHSRDVCCRAED